ncbi:hypothetical protein MRX96_050103 [Rhipicephalus microplus]
MRTLSFPLCAGAPGSRVVGAMMDGVFSGRISLTPGDDDGDFYVERVNSYLSSSSSPTALFHSLIYAAKDVSFDGTGCGVRGHAQDVPVGIRRPDGRASSKVIARRMRPWTRNYPSENRFKCWIIL